MFTNGFCNTVTWGQLGNYGGWSSIGWLMNLAFGAFLLAGITVLVIWAIRRIRFSAATGPYSAGDHIRSSPCRLNMHVAR